MFTSFVIGDSPMTDSTFSPEVFTRPAPGFTLNTPFAKGTYEGELPGDDVPGTTGIPDR